MMICDSSRFGANAAPSGTVLFSSDTPGAWSYTHQYGAQSVYVELWGPGGDGDIVVVGVPNYPTPYYMGGGGGGYTKSSQSVANNGVLSGTLGSPGISTTCTQAGDTAASGSSSSGTTSGDGGAGSGGNVTNGTGTSGVSNSYGGGAYNGGGNKTSVGVGTTPGGGGYAAAGANGRVRITAV